MSMGDSGGDDLNVSLSWPEDEVVSLPPRPAVKAQPPAEAKSAPPPAARPRPSGRSAGHAPRPTIGATTIVDHLTTLSQLVTGTARASTAEIEALGARVEQAVNDLDTLHLKILRSLAGFDALRARVQNEMSNRPQLTDEEIDRIADAVTDQLLNHVRVETDNQARPRR